MSGRRRCSAALLIAAKWQKDETRRARLSSQTRPACERASARTLHCGFPRRVKKDGNWDSGVFSQRYIICAFINMQRALGRQDGGRRSSKSEIPSPSGLISGLACQTGLLLYFLFLQCGHFFFHLLFFCQFFFSLVWMTHCWLSFLRRVKGHEQSKRELGCRFSSEIQ